VAHQPEGAAGALVDGLTGVAVSGPGVNGTARSGRAGRPAGRYGARMGRRDRGELIRHFEGGEVLQGLLELAGSPLDAAAAVERLKAGAAEGKAPGEVFPSLFEGEPRFADPEIARRLYQNLFGVWDLLSEGRTVDLRPPGEKAPRVKKPKPVAPPPFAPGEPDEAFVETAWRYLEDLDDRGMQRHEHSFENRQDHLLGYLDESGLSDDGYAVARHLLFELHAMLELGWPQGVRSIPLAELKGGGDAKVPPALQAYVDEALFEAEQDEEAPLKPPDAAKVRDVVQRGLSALWNARKV